MHSSVNPGMGGIWRFSYLAKVITRGRIYFWTFQKFSGREGVAQIIQNSGFQYLIYAAVKRITRIVEKSRCQGGFQKALGSPACFKTALTKCREGMSLSTTKR
jgi:hypothetical protein